MKQLHQLLKTSNKLLIAGTRSTQENDNGIGIYILRNIDTISTIMPLTIEADIKKQVDELNHLEPDALILIDVVNFNREPGYAQLLSLHDINPLNASPCNMKLNMPTHALNMPVYMLGIQPLHLDDCNGFSLPVQKAADTIISLINSLPYARTKVGQ